MKVYLAGPINHRTFDQANDWRLDAITYLSKHGIQGYNPLRAKDFLRQQLGDKPLWDSYEDHPLASARGILTRDAYDVRSCDLMLANFLGAERCSAGTPIEFGIAHALNKPVVMVMEQEGSPFDHPMIRAIAGYRITTLTEGLAICVAILNP